MSLLGVLFCADVSVLSISIGLRVAALVEVGVVRSERFIRSIPVAVGVGLSDMGD